MSFPRKRNGYVDDGNPSKRQRRCPNCSSSAFKTTVSLEHCASCNYTVDYWGNGGNDVADAYELRRNREHEMQQEAIRRKEEELWRQEEEMWRYE